MNVFRICLAGALMLLTGCLVPDAVTERGFVDSTGTATAENIAERDYDLRKVTLGTEGELTVSEANRYYPSEDVVWRGDPLGDRVAQVLAMFKTAMDRNDRVLRGRTPVDVEISLKRFHGVTERTRFSIGGNYNAIFYMTVRNARTGEVIEPRRQILGNLEAPGGEAALELDRQGQTEKVRVTDYLTALLFAELTGQATQ